MKKRALSHLNKYLVQYKYYLLTGILFVFLNNFFGSYQGPVIRETIDYLEQSLPILKSATGVEKEHLQTEFGKEVTFLVLKILGLTIFSGIFLYFQRKIIIGTSRRIEYDLKNEIYHHYQVLPVSFYKRNNTGDIMNRISEDVNQVRNYLGPAIMYGINLFAIFSVTIPLMISVNVELTLYTLIPLPFLVISIYTVQSIITKHSEQIQRSMSNLSSLVQETFSGIRVVKSFGREAAMSSQFNDQSNGYKDKSIRLTQINALFFPLMVSLIGASIIFIIWIGGTKAISKDGITTGNIAEFIFYLNKLAWPVTSLGWITVMIKRAEVSQGRINQFLDEKNTLIKGKELTTPITGAIEFKDVSFKYPDTGIEGARNISFNVLPGQTIAIIGNTGSGKSTIASLLCRLYDTTTGAISIDGINIKDYNLQYLRSQIGFVPQDVFLFSDTIRNNIAFGFDNVSEEQIIEAATFADLYTSIQQFPLGLDTILGERGITLSGGQKQRLSLARAFIRNPRLFILDDCLSAVDTKTEDTILTNLKEVLGDRSTIIISHRVSSVKLADKIIVLEDGQIVQSGSHNELIQLDGIYKNIYMMQLHQPV
ncbi:ABC transporter ATP-binding protein [uncultured Cytophaga sp.]|uniref:ABC transporter ATP-binding protein n=1 Tax=uncultured Cytophaga sp. TaxID=160238 RepID=UPI00261B2886|nr:ABC transporter ATP-binding protein [uncultured Cytophaga sp.]